MAALFLVILLLISSLAYIFYNNARKLRQEIIKRKQIEKELLKLSKAVEQSPASIVITDTEGNIDYANPKAIETTGYSIAELKGKNPRILKSGETSNSEYKTLWTTITSGKQWTGTFHNQRKNGEQYWESCTISPILDSEGKVTHYLAIKEDITEYKKVHDELIESDTKLRESIATKDKLFSIIAHDLRGPIGSFAPILELLTSDEEIEEDARNAFMEGLLTCSRSAFDLLENLLSWAKSQSDGIKLKPVQFDITEKIARAIELLSAAANQKEIKIQEKGDDICIIYADKETINLVIRNLLSNAIKFTPEKGLIVISAYNKDNLVEVSVEDNGVGMEKEVLDKLFHSNSFYTSYGTNNEKGTGLGLLLCKDFVEKNGGKIRVESTPGKGSKFTFTIPKGEIG